MGWSLMLSGKELARLLMSQGIPSGEGGKYRKSSSLILFLMLYFIYTDYFHRMERFKQIIHQSINT